MARRPRPGAGITVALVVLALAGCARGPATADSTGTSASPTAACPVVEGQPTPTGCVPYDGEASMRQNEAYRQRGTLPEKYRARAEAHRLRILTALANAVAEESLGPAEVRAVLAPLGFASVEAYGRSDVGGGIAVGVSTDAGCVYGGVRGTEVTLEAGAGIADGGCLPAQGH